MFPNLQRKDNHGARAGKDGIAISILCSRDYENFSNILKDEKLKIDEVKTPWCERVNIIIEETKRFGRQGERSFSSRRPHGRDSGPRARKSFSRGQSKPPMNNRGFGKGIIMNM